MAPQKQRTPKPKASVKPAADAPVLRNDEFNIVAVVQAGRLQYEAILLAALKTRCLAKATPMETR